MTLEARLTKIERTLNPPSDRWSLEQIIAMCIGVPVDRLGPVGVGSNSLEEIICEAVSAEREPDRVRQAWGAKVEDRR